MDSREPVANWDGEPPPDLVERFPEAAQPPSTPAEDDPIPDDQYRWMVRQVIHRGFKRMGFDFDEGENDPEMVKRGLERVIVELGEESRLTVKVENPTRVAVKLRGGHSLPFTRPKTRGLASWAAEVNAFIFADSGTDEHLIEPRGVSTAEALEKTTTTVAEMDLADMLIVDADRGRVRLRRSRDVVSPESSTSAEGAERYLGADFVDEVIDDFIAGDTNSYRFPGHHFAEQCWGDGVDERIEGLGNHGGIGGFLVFLLEKVIRERGVEQELGVGFYGDWDVRLERLPARRVPAKAPIPGSDGLLHLRRNQQLAVDDFFAEFYWGLLRSGDEAAEFPLEDFIVRVYGEHRDAFLAQSSRVAGGVDWTVFQVLDGVITDRDRGERYVVRYYGRDDLRVEVVDGARERRWAARTIGDFLHKHAEDGSNSLTLTFEREGKAELAEFELWREVEERGSETRFEVETMDGNRVSIVYDPRGPSAGAGVPPAPENASAAVDCGAEAELGERRHELAPGELEIPEALRIAIRDFLASGVESVVCPSPDPDIPIQTILMLMLVAVRNLELENSVSVSMDAEGVRLERSDLAHQLDVEVPEQFTEMVELFVASGQDSAPVSWNGGEVPIAFLRMVIDRAIKDRGFGPVVWVDEDAPGQLVLHRLRSDLDASGASEVDGPGNLETETGLIQRFLESDGAIADLSGDEMDATSMTGISAALSQAIQNLGVEDRVFVISDAAGLHLKRTDPGLLARWIARAIDGMLGSMDAAGSQGMKLDLGEIPDAADVVASEMEKQIGARGLPSTFRVEVLDDRHIRVSRNG